MKKYDTPVMTITVIKSEEIMIVSGALSTKAQQNQGSFPRKEITF